MAQMNVSLPDGLKVWAESRVADGDYSSTSDYVRDLMRRDRERVIEREQDAAAWLRSEVEHGLASGMSERTLQDIYDANQAHREAA